MEVVEEKQHEGIQQYYITKIEALQVNVLYLHDFSGIMTLMVRLK